MSQSVMVCLYLILFVAFCPLWGASAEVSNASPASPQTPPTAQTTAPPATSPAASAPASVNGAPGFWTENFLAGDWGGSRDQLKNDGFTLTPTYTGEVFGNPSGGARQGVISDGLFNFVADFDLDAMSDGALQDTTIHANAFYIYGTSLSEQDVGDFSNTSNIAAYNTLRLDELWIQKGFWDKKLTLKVGNMAVDNEFFQSSSAALFLNGTFGAFTFIANNVPNAPVYPLASPGVRLQVQPDPHYYAMAGVYGMDVNSNPAVNNRNGTRFAFDTKSGVLIMSEVGYLLNQGPNEKGLQGSYRVGSFVHTANYPTWSSQAQIADGTGLLESGGTNYGIYGVLDQQISVEGSKIISLFVRSGGAPSNVDFIDYYVEGGFNFTGFIPGRDQDVAGLALARSHISEEYSNAQIAEGNPPSTAETVIEATYKIQLSPWWSVQPDVQYIVTPSGVEGSRNATVIGLRTNVAF